jgi:hypothetical protein
MPVVVVRHYVSRAERYCSINDNQAAYKGTHSCILNSETHQHQPTLAPTS